MQIAYFEMQGTGNKIVVVDQRETSLPPPDSSRLRQLALAADSPVFDQLMWVSPAENPEHAASYRVFNADGSEVEQCGNGVRCVARLLAGQRAGTRRFTLSSPAGPVAVRVEENAVAVCMGRPEFQPVRIPFLADKAAERYELAVDETLVEVEVVSMGNPHCVLRVDDVAEAPVQRLGPRVETHDRFPQKTNVGFMHVIDAGNIDLRVHERGVGETLACGTGACAAVVCGRRAGCLDEQVTVNLPGGQVMVSWPGDTEPVWLTGNAELISEGILYL